MKARFPFPFQADSYQYSNNLQPLDSQIAIQVTSDYLEEIKLKRNLLQQYPSRCYQADTSTLSAQWEVLDHLLHELNEVYPQYFHLQIQGQQWHFHNTLTGERLEFEFGNIESIGMDPLNFVGRHVQEDLILMIQQDDELCLGAGQLCFPGNWSLQFDHGMPFLNIHNPVPNLVESGLAEKIQKFLLHIDPGKPWTRVNWSLNVGRRLDTSPETFDEWGMLRYQVTARNISTLLHLRVEEQTLVRMPESYSLLFTIHSYLLPLRDLVRNPQWLKITYHVLRMLPAPIRKYKGLDSYYDLLIGYLEEQLSRHT